MIFNDILWYIFIASTICGIGILGVFLKRKFNVKSDELEFVKLILNAVDYVTSKTEIKYKGEISVIISYCMDAITYVNEYEVTKTNEGKKNLIIKKTIEICEENNIKVDNEFISLVGEIVDYFILFEK